MRRRSLLELLPAGRAVSLPRAAAGGPRACDPSAHPAPGGPGVKPSSTEPGGRSKRLRPDAANNARAVSLPQAATDSEQAAGRAVSLPRASTGGPRACDPSAKPTLGGPGVKPSSTEPGGRSKPLRSDVAHSPPDCPSRAVADGDGHRPLLDEAVDLAGALHRLLQAASPSVHGPVDAEYTTGSALACARAACAALDLGVVYDEAMFDSLGLTALGPEAHSRTDAFLLQGGRLDDVISAATSRLRSKGNSVEQLREKFSASRYPGRHRVLDMLVNGQRPFLKSGFKFNKGKEFQQSSSYKEKRPIVNDCIAELIREGRAVAVRKEVLQASGQWDGIHVSPLTWAPKAKQRKGRVCYNLSKATSSHQSINDGTDLAAHDTAYPEMKLCSLADLCELACQMQERYPGQQISGATVDVASAYQQGTCTVKAAKQFATQVEYRDPVLQAFVALIIVYVVGVFGYTRAGHVYATFGACIDYHHNAGRPRRSHTYVDDGIIIDLESKVPASVADYVQEIRSLFGAGGVSEKKTIIYDKRVEAIGWVLDFVSWRVYPRQKGLDKMMAYLFVVVPAGAAQARRVDIETLVGVLQFYASAIPAGRSFLASLYSLSPVRGRAKSVWLTPRAQDDLTWWRAVALVAFRCPRLVGDRVVNLRLSAVPSLYMRTDASTSTGGGGYLSLVRGGEPLPLPGGAIRWTRAEFEAFRLLGVSINTLEYFAAMYLVMLWADRLRGSVVGLECDNTAAVSWFSAMRSRGGQGMDALSRVFTLFCLTHDITLVCSHISGIDNTSADFLSRDLDVLAQDGDETLLHGPRSVAWPWQAYCRQLLLRCITAASSMHGHKLVEELTAALGRPGYSSAT